MDDVVVEALAHVIAAIVVGVVVELTSRVLGDRGESGDVGVLRGADEEIIRELHMEEGGDDIPAC